jgi:hypothetical protein
MLEFASNTDVTIEVPYEYNGKHLTLTGFEYELLDATEQYLSLDRLTLTLASGTASTLAIPASLTLRLLSVMLDCLTVILSMLSGEYM